MNIPLLFTLAYLFPLTIIQMLITNEKKLTSDEILDITRISIVPVLNIVFLVILTGIKFNVAISKKDKQ